MTTTTKKDDKRTKNKTTNDPISDFLARVKNAGAVKKDTVAIPYSNVKKSLADLLQREGYITSNKIINEDDVTRKSIEITLKYDEKGNSVISGSRRRSKPGLRVYSKGKYAPRVFDGLGISVISSNKGLVTDKTARKEKVGGEILCEIW